MVPQVLLGGALGLVGGAVSGERGEWVLALIGVLVIAALVAGISIEQPGPNARGVFHGASVGLLGLVGIALLVCLVFGVFFAVEQLLRAVPGYTERLPESSQYMLESIGTLVLVGLFAWLGRSVTALAGAVAVALFTGIIILGVAAIAFYPMIPVLGLAALALDSWPQGVLGGFLGALMGATYGSLEGLIAWAASDIFSDLL
jgi:hypothetical protein